MVTRLLLVLIFFLSTLCVFAQSQPSPSESSPDASTKPDPSTKDQATGQPAQFAYIHVYRHRRYVGSALAPTITVDEMKVARVGSGRRFTARIAPGTHTIRSDDKSSMITIEAAAEQHYYVRVDEEPGAWKGHGRLTLLMPEQGKPEYQLQKPVEAERRFAKEMLMEDGETAKAENK